MSERESKVELTVACRLPEPEFAARRRTVADEILRGALGVDELEDGYAFTFACDEERTLELARFVAAERLCCPFFTFELLFEPDGGPVRLRLRGPEGAKALIRTMMGQDGGL